MDNDTTTAVRENQATSPPQPGGLPDLPATLAELRAILDGIPRGPECSITVLHRVSSSSSEPVFECSVHHAALRRISDFTCDGADARDLATLVNRFREFVLPRLQKAFRVQARVDLAMEDE